VESSPLKNPDHGSKAPAVLVTLKGSTKQPPFARTDEVVRSGSKGNHNDKNVHRPPSTTIARSPSLANTRCGESGYDFKSDPFHSGTSPHLFPHTHSRSFSYKRWTRIWSWGFGHNCNRAGCSRRRLSRQN
jgi:hypothetical protein